MNKTKGIFYVLAGAASYGVLATFVKLAYQQGYQLFDVLAAQYLPGIICMFIIMQIQARGNSEAPAPATRNTKLKLICGGSSYGLTGLFYYQALQYASVSMCIILLMQTIWLGVVLEAILLRKMPALTKIAGMVTAIIGTLLAVNYWSAGVDINLNGLLWGFAAAVSYTIALTVSNGAATSMRPAAKSFYILTGSVIAIAIAAIIFQPSAFKPGVFLPWGILAIFGTVLPPILFAKGFPATGLGLGSILIAIEIPVSMAMAYFILHEKVLPIQWLGALVIIMSMVILNINKLFGKRSAAGG